MSLKHLVIPDSDEVIKVLRIVSKELRSQPEDAPSHWPKTNKLHINENENSDDI